MILEFLICVSKIDNFKVEQFFTHWFLQEIISFLDSTEKKNKSEVCMIKETKEFHYYICKFWCSLGVIKFPFASSLLINVISILIPQTILINNLKKCCWSNLPWWYNLPCHILGWNNIHCLEHILFHIFHSLVVWAWNKELMWEIGWTLKTA